MNRRSALALALATALCSTALPSRANKGAPPKGKPAAAAKPGAKPAAKGADKDKGKDAKAAPGKPSVKVALARALRGLGKWRRNDALHDLVLKFAFAKMAWKRGFTREDSSVARAQGVAGLGAKGIEDQSVDTLARALFVLQQEAPGAANGLRAKVMKRVVERHGLKVDTGPDVLAQTAFYHELYNVPCRSQVRRVGKAWPPHYECVEKPQAPTHTPLPILALSKAPHVIPPLSDADKKDKDPPKGSAQLATDRKQTLAKRDKGDAALAAIENLKSMPTQFCVKGACHGAYAQVASAIYGGGKGYDTLPVFCAPKDKKQSAAGTEWDTSKVECSGDWLGTLGGWNPWLQNGEAAPAPEPGVIPDYACFGSPHLLKDHMVLPDGGKAGQGFYCRKRLFRILAKKGEKSLADVNQNIALMCAEMRMQVWGEKYPDINKQYQEWCRKDAARVKKGICLPPGSPLPGEAGSPPLPFMLLSREEMLYFFGHQELYCRADRKGMTHFLYNKEWAPSFTCGVPRGLLEAGPFEEGVQACAIAPYVGDEPMSNALTEDQLKSRLHCWRFDRPTCEELSNPETAEKKDSLWRSNVFDAYDALREARRTRVKEAWGLFDMKDAEKLADFTDKLAFQDQGKDEGTFGVKEFCRFVGSTKRIQCGYTKTTMAQYYELHENDVPEGCSSGVCARGAYKRGYYCSLFSSHELFGGKPYWMCGVDAGVAGHKLLDDARAICVGGARSEHFLSAKGDKGSLQCYERRFRWGESEKSEDYLRQFEWAEAVKAAAKIEPHYEPWLHGGEEAHAWASPQLPPMPPGKVDIDWVKKSVEWVKKAQGVQDAKDTRPGQLVAAEKRARETLKQRSADDEKDLVRWARHHGHTLGHRTAIRLGLVDFKHEKVPAIMRKLKELTIKEDSKHEYSPYGCEGKECYKIAFEGENKEKPVDKNRAKELNELIDDVVEGRRAADARWYQDFRLAATEDGQLRVSPGALATALRVHHLFQVLASARRILLNHARKYADAVLAHAHKSKLLSRLELLERARSAAIPARYKGNVFCVSDPAGHHRSGLPEYVCASSPLLVAGAVEDRVYKKLKQGHFAKKNEEQKEKFRRKVRSKIKFGWCYGGMQGWPLYGHNPTHALSERDREPPYLMEMPASVVGDRIHKTRKIKLNFKFKAERSTRVLERLAGTQTSPRDIGESLLASPPAAPKKKAAPKGGKDKGAKPGGKKGDGKGKKSDLSPYRPSELQKRKASVNWVKCGGFQFSDENWEDADPSREPKKDKGAAKSVAAAPSGGDPRASEETAKIMAEVGGLIISVVKVVMPKFGDALQRVSDLAHAAHDFYEKYVKKFIEIAKKVWEAAKGNVQAGIEAVEKLRGTLEDGFRDAKKAAVDAANPQASETIRQKAKDADDKVTEIKNKIKEADKKVETLVSAAQKAVTVPNTGDLLSPMLEDLVKMATERVTAVIDPNARSLLSQGFKFIRSFLDPIAQSVISSLAGIPFVGAALAALGQVAYSFAMTALEDAAGDALMGIVERLLSKILRTVITPVFKAVANKVLELAAGFCQGIMGQHSRACPKELKFSALPPKDAWIERALVCQPKRLPAIWDEIQREAAVAQRHIFETGARMRKRVAVYARDLADRYLARFGYTYDTWMAAVGHGPTPALAARAQSIQRALLHEVAQRKVQAR